MPEISVIIANWNGKHFLEDCLSSLRRQTFRDFETILVDNGSNDGSADYVRQNFPEVRLLALAQNLGFTGGNIAGHKLAQGNLIVLLNNDTEADSEWLQEIRNASICFPDAGSFASKMMYFDDRRRIENCGFELSMAGTTSELGRDELDSPEWAYPRKIFGACAGAAAYRRNMLDDIGFLDPDFFMIYEDVDLSFRAQLAGYRCVYLPKAVVYHRYRSTIRKRPGTQVFYAQRNIELVYLKNLPTALVLRSAPTRLLYEIGAFVYFFRFGAGTAFLRAKVAALLKLPSILRKRWTIQKRKTVKNSELCAVLRRSAFSAKWKKFSAIRKASSESISSSIRAQKRVTERSR
ncbi:MAG TPA: glycosyltransferase family 2 protein [Candidatus Sulfotelmatobacter sp.]|nr:glycosyltransferase family 2 protein [Candidatus Sulfotelmatobacter sp.]